LALRGYGGESAKTAANARTTPHATPSTETAVARVVGSERSAKNNVKRVPTARTARRNVGASTETAIMYPVNVTAVPVGQALFCPEGYYGDHCMTPCECKSDNFVCHPARGCICRHGYAGTNCDEPIVLSRIHATSNDNSNYGSVIAGVIVAIIALVAAGCIFIYYRRRVSNLKTEIAHVQYIADPNGFSPDRNHFDNLVYSYQGGAKRDNEHLLNNSKQIRNNLHKPTNTNLERARLGVACCSTDEEDFPSKGYGSDELQSLKNREADATNPNIYHSIDKIDHVYDEIKQKDIKDIELEYDHLDYTRPVTTQKPHYQRMPSPFGSRDLVKSDKSETE
ncbi:multiple epidermal growth factor-like domains protein 10, partial [Asbolus verrucosus]